MSERLQLAELIYDVLKTHTPVHASVAHWRCIAVADALLKADDRKFREELAMTSDE
jgi:hypothetical protein